MSIKKYPPFSSPSYSSAKPRRNCPTYSVLVHNTESPFGTTNPPLHGFLHIGVECPERDPIFCAQQQNRGLPPPSRPDIYALHLLAETSRILWMNNSRCHPHIIAPPPVRYKEPRRRAFVDNRGGGKYRAGLMNPGGGGGIIGGSLWAGGPVSIYWWGGPIIGSGGGGGTTKISLSFSTSSLPPSRLFPSPSFFSHSKPNRFHSFSRTHIEWGGVGRKGRKKEMEQEGGKISASSAPPPPSPLSPFLIQFSIFFLPRSFFRGSTKLPFFPPRLFLSPSSFLGSVFLGFSPSFSFPFLLPCCVCLPCGARERKR